MARDSGYFFFTSLLAMTHTARALHGFIPRWGEPRLDVSVPYSEEASAFTSIKFD